MQRGEGRGIADLGGELLPRRLVLRHRRTRLLPLLVQLGPHIRQRLFVRLCLRREPSQAVVNVPTQLLLHGVEEVLDAVLDLGADLGSVESPDKSDTGVRAGQVVLCKADTMGSHSTALRDSRGEFVTSRTAKVSKSSLSTDEGDGKLQENAGGLTAGARTRPPEPP